MSIPFGFTVDSKMRTFLVDGDGKLIAQVSVVVVDSTPARTPIQVSATLGVAIDLGTLSAAESPAGWELIADGDWYVGKSGSQLRLVKADEAWALPSSTLAGWYARSAGTPTLVVTGAEAV